MFQAKVRKPQKPLLHPAYYSEEFKEYEASPSSIPALTTCYFVGSAEDFDIFKGWLLAQGIVNMDEVVRVESLDSPELLPYAWSQILVTYFTREDPCS